MGTGVRSLEEQCLFERDKPVTGRSCRGRLTSKGRRRQDVDALLLQGRRRRVFSSKRWTHPSTRKIAFWRHWERSAVLPVLEDVDEGLEAQKPREGPGLHAATSS